MLEAGHSLSRGKDRAMHRLIPLSGDRNGTLAGPDQARGLILFAHGSGSSRLSPRNAAVAQILVERGFGTLLFDLLTESEACDRGNVFDIALLASRLEDAMTHLTKLTGMAKQPLGLFGASTGAAAALVAAARRPERVFAVVSRGGRPDLAGQDLARVRAPTLLIVGGHDSQVLALNRSAMSQMSCEARLHIIPGATHLFEEPGALEAVSLAAADWFEEHLSPEP
ncbi:dienelactone hydrolase family protein [Alsobacter soli]